MLAVICNEKLRAELCQVREVHSLVRMLDLAGIQYVIEDWRKTAQSPECLQI
jgi:hypothetical protein